jgi:hypothetical membrane protein
MKLYRLVGPIGAVVAYPFIIVSILLSPWFNFYDNALSDLGNMTLNGPVALVYNSGLVLSGALVASFAFLVSVKNRSWKYLCWSILLTVAGADLALIGIFPEDAGKIHGLVSEIFFVSIILVMLIYSYCSWPLGSPIAGAIALAFSIASAITWVVSWPWRGVAIQETITSLMAAIWLIILSLFENSRS